jgi:hypothetical protein
VTDRVDERLRLPQIFLALINGRENLAENLALAL